MAVERRGTSSESEPSPAFYALRGGGWRDWWTLLHPPYTIWHLSYVAIGVAAAPVVRLDRMGATLLAFFFAVGLGAHALDELNGRPLRTRIPAFQLRLVAGLSIGAAVVLGSLGVERVGATLIPFIAFGAFIVIAYNLELAGGLFHSDLWFAFAWGAFPAFTGFWASATTFRLAGVLAAAACFMLSVAQRTLSTPVRALRRRTRRVQGQIERNDGAIEPIDRHTLTAAPEQALRALSLAVPMIAAALVIARVTG
jgi:ABC-type branched-subunit amino acid transport system permease subunit